MSRMAKQKRETKQSIRKRTLQGAREHIIAQGETVYAANILHDAFFKLFLSTLSLERRDKQHLLPTIRFHEHALAIWHIIQSDKSQREMALKAISSIPTELKLSPAISRLKWAKAQSDTLSEYRNLVAHSPIMFGYRRRKDGKGFEFGPSFTAVGMRPIHAQRLNLITGLSLWRLVRDDLLKLADYIDAVQRQIDRLSVESQGGELLTSPKTWPRRPRLQSLPHLRAIARTLQTAGQPQRQRNRRQSSRGKRPVL